MHQQDAVNFVEHWLAHLLLDLLLLLMYPLLHWQDLLIEVRLGWLLRLMYLGNCILFGGGKVVL